MKKLIAFDLDETVTETRSAITDEMSELLGELLKHYQVCVISGGGFGQFEKQLLSNLFVDKKLLKYLHLMPTCGTRYHAYNLETDSWKEVYAETLSADQRKEITSAIEEAMVELGHPLKEAKGKVIDDRGSQITYQALGLGAEASEKKAWDPNDEKKAKIRDVIAPKLPNFEVRVGGTTSIDVTTQGMDKAYGIKRLIEQLGITKEDILFIGDRIWEGGNDYPVKLMGIDCVAVHGFEHTPWVVRGILAVS